MPRPRSRSRESPRRRDGNAARSSTRAPRPAARVTRSEARVPTSTTGTPRALAGSALAVRFLRTLGGSGGASSTTTSLADRRARVLRCDVVAPGRLRFLHPRHRSADSPSRGSRVGRVAAEAAILRGRGPLQGNRPSSLRAATLHDSDYRTPYRSLPARCPPWVRAHMFTPQTLPSSDRNIHRRLALRMPLMPPPFVSRSDTWPSARPRRERRPRL